MIEHGDALRPLLERVIGPITEVSQTFAWRQGDRYTCLVSFFNVRNGDMEIAGAAVPGGIHRRMIRELVRYVFEDQGCARLTARVVEDNEACLRLMQRLGFELEGRLRRADNGRDVLVFGLLKEDCEHGERRKAPEAG